MCLSRRNALRLMLTAMSAPEPVHAREVGRPVRIGALAPGTPESGAPFIAAFVEGLRSHGYIDGRNLDLQLRYAAGRTDRLAPLASELVALPSDVVVTFGLLPVRALRQVSSTVPIVMVAPDPVGSGFAESLARPGKNVTGIAFMDIELTAKRLDLLRRIVPALTRIALLWNPDGSGAAGADFVTSAAGRIGIQTVAIEVNDAEELSQAVARARAQGAQAVLPMSSTFFNRNRKALAEALQSQRMPASCEVGLFVAEGGCLMSYGADYLALFARIAYFVDRILKGAKPGELPIEQPREFELVINLKTAQALGLAIPNEVLLQATEVIR